MTKETKNTDITNSKKESFEVACLKDDLTEAARLAECSTLILSDMVQDFFEAYDSCNSEDTFNIVYEYNRYRAYADICLDMLNKLTQELHKRGIYYFSE